MTKAQFTKTVKTTIKVECGDIPIICRKDGSIIIKKSYFYTFGKTAQDWADEVATYLKAAGLSAQVVGDNHWEAWPKTSYFWAIVTEE